ncbi:MAG: RecQ family ATP-dependent DNA helicase [Gemmatimonadota bacterium]
MPDALRDALHDALHDARDVLASRFGHADFRDGQREAGAAVCQGRDALVVLPTGGGKSICYQIPALMREGITVVLSPLISLMKDQVDALTARGIPAAFVNSTLNGREIADRFARVRDGSLKLLYVAPERFELGRTADRLRDAGVGLLAVDEAHCISEWGHDFRPSYRRVQAIRDALGQPQTVALTATATPAVRRDIAEQLGLRDPAIVVSGFDRHNLQWHVLPMKGDAQKDATLLALLRQVPGPAIVYAATRKHVERVAQWLDRQRVPARAYHAGLDDDERRDVQEAFLGDRVRVIVATNAFGMGIDKPDVRLVVHWAMPGSLEAYYQEAGRAGRDGARSHCVLLHAFPDRFTHEFFIKASHPDADVVRGVYDALGRLASKGGLVDADSGVIAGRMPGRVSDKAVESALRVLQQGTVLDDVGPGDAFVRLRWTPAEVTQRLGAGASPALDLLRALWRAAGTRLPKGAVVSLDRLPVSDAGPDSVTDVLDVLDALARDGAIEWRRLSAGLALRQPGAPLSRFPLDWDGLERRRRAANDQLDAMQRYAYADRCRRAFVLRYFGDPAGRATGDCGGCDRCLGDARPFTVAEPARGAGAVAGGRTRTAKPSPPREAPEALTAEESARFDALRAWRARVAREGRLPAYTVLPDRSLKAMAVEPPRSLADLHDVPGIGPAKLDRYGEALLRVLAALPAVGPPGMQ